MHVLLISACEKKALSRTRRVLDSYALRVGERTWASSITQEGLREIRLALKRKATRQTAVACYQNDGRRRMKLVWTVGSKGQFGPNGHYPSGTTSKGHKARYPPPSAWIRLGCKLVEAAGLMHDIGKGSQRFQNKLRIPSNDGDDVRHEWISLKIIQHLRKHRGDWLGAWNQLTIQLDSVVLGERKIDSSSTNGISNYLEAIDFLIVSHHGLLESDEKLPTAKGRHVRRQPLFEQITPHEGQIDPALFDRYWAIEKSLSKFNISDTIFWRALITYARAALIFSDHSVSRLLLINKDDRSQLFANTRTEEGRRILNQTLNWHLANVATRAREVMWRLGTLTSNSEDTELVGLSEESVVAVTKPSESSTRFAWQNRCGAALARARSEYPGLGALVFNMASTGAGKTRMNARAACLLSRAKNPRFSIALNLRSLTLQTGDALKNSLDLGDDEIAVVIGDKTATDLFRWGKAADALALDYSDNVDENKIEPEISCIREEHPIPPWMEPLFSREIERKVVGAPLLVSTIDFLINAGNPGAQGHHVKALLRLMTSDLVLDEIDAYEPPALVAVLRLVQMSALFRRNVICSSATLSKPIASAIERAYRSGCDMLARLESFGKEQAAENNLQETSTGFIRALIDDELEPNVKAVSANIADFENVYTTRLGLILEHLHRKSTYRLAELTPLNRQSPDEWLRAVYKSALELHSTNAWQLHLGRHVSFGLVRVANISTAIEVARYLADNIPESRIACYHSNDFPIARFHKERTLDKLLSRGRGDEHIRRDLGIKTIVESSSYESVPFIVVATPVEEIGRDHDFDWAVVEPSSAQSIVQTCGRVNRHRMLPCEGRPNVKILQFNYRHCKNVYAGSEGSAAFIFPGFETTSNTRRANRDYLGHDLCKLLSWNGDRLSIDAAIRFDSTRFHFARADDKAIEKIVDEYFGQNKGYFILEPSDIWTLTSGPYDRTQLRDNSRQQQTWRLVVDHSCSIFFRKKRVAGKYGLVDRWHEECVDFVARRQNAWLYLSPMEMVELCEEVGISTEAAMEVELSTFEDLDRFEYDEGFGFARLKR